MTAVRPVCRRFGICLLAAVALLGGHTVAASANGTAQAPPFSQSWSDTGLIAFDDQWGSVPGVVGYRGDDLTTATGTDPQTVLADGSATPVDVTANQTNPSGFATGGVAEFHLSDPAVALNGSGTADAPHVVLALDTSGRTGISVSYNVRDLDGSTDNAAQPVALQYRVGSSGPFTNVPAGFVADGTTGPSQATLVTPVSATLPGAADNQPLVQVRIVTTNAVGNDEWVGIDDILVTGALAPGDAAPAVASTAPAAGAAGVPVASSVTLTFSEPVAVAGAWYSIEGSVSGPHTVTVAGGPLTYTLDPDTDFVPNETVSVRVLASAVADVDGDDPPDQMSSDFTLTFLTVVRIHDIQGQAHRSPLVGVTVADVPGVVTAVSRNGFWLQDPEPDSSPATSEGLFVFTSTPPTVATGASVLVGGRVTEFRPGGSGGQTNLTTTELTLPTVRPGEGVGPIVPTVVGPGGRVPPGTVIEDDATGDVEASGVFDPDADGIDFYESLEGMVLQVDDAEVVGPTNQFGEIPVVPQGASVRTSRGGIVIRLDDFNPERLLVDDTLVGPAPQANVGATLPGALVGVLDYSFGNFKLLNVAPLPAPVGGAAREVASPAPGGQLSIGTYNVENLDPLDGPARFDAIADQIVNRLRSPDLVALVEVQDNNGPTNDAVVDGSATGQMLIAAVLARGGPAYSYTEVDPADDQDGGEPGGNIRVGYLYSEERGLHLVSRPGGDAVTPVQVVADNKGDPHLSISPGRIDPLNPAFANSRKPLAAEFTFHGQTVFVVNNHFNSKGGDQPLFGRFQPPQRSSEAQRHAQAAVVNGFVSQVLTLDPQALVAVVGDLNDFQFSETLQILKGGVLHDLVDDLPVPEQYSYVFEGNSQVLDHMLTSDALYEARTYFDVVHINSEFADQISDHDPSVAHFRITGQTGRG